MAVLGLTLFVGAWGAISWIVRRPSVLFWYLLRIAQAAIVVSVALGGLLLVGEHKPSEDIHMLYGLLPLVVMFIGEAMRVGTAASELGDQDVYGLEQEEQQAVALRIVRHETGIMAVAALLAFALAVRATMTAGYF